MQTCGPDLVCQYVAISVGPPPRPEWGLADEGRDAAGGYFHVHGRAGHHEIAMYLTERDWSELRRARRACHPTDLTICGHLFGTTLSDADKWALLAFLKTF